MSLNIKIEFKEFPKKFTCDGEDFSPKIEITGIKPEIKTLAIICDDPDAPGRIWTHWTAWNINPINVIPENIPKKDNIMNPIKIIQGKNDFGKTGYNGPCPPKGKPHRYFFKIYGLDISINLPSSATKVDLENVMKNHILQQGETVATYRR